MSNGRRDRRFCVATAPSPSQKMADNRLFYDDGEGAVATHWDLSSAEEDGRAGVIDAGLDRVTKIRLIPHTTVRQRKRKRHLQNLQDL